MTLSTRVQSIDRDVALMLIGTPEARSAMFAEAAKQQIDDAKQVNKTILGRVPRTTISVDGQDGAPLESVKPDGVIIAEFELFNDVLSWIADQLITHSPVGGSGDKHPGLYQQSHTLFADSVEVDVGGVIPFASEYVFLNLTVYSRKIEKGSSSQAPDGVYQAVAVLGQRRFGNIAKISFGYRTPLSGALVGGHAGNNSAGRQPAVIVKIGDR